jgi:hypothetical protein
MNERYALVMLILCAIVFAPLSGGNPLLPSPEIDDHSLQINDWLEKDWTNELLLESFAFDNEKVAFCIQIYKEEQKKIGSFEQPYYVIRNSSKGTFKVVEDYKNSDFTIKLTKSALESLLECKNKEDFIATFFDYYLNKEEIKIEMDEYGKLVISQSLEWKFQTNDAVISSPTLLDIANDNELEILVGSDDGYLYCLNANGSLYWEYETGEVKSGPLAIDIDHDGKKEILATSMDGNIYCLSNEGKLKWKVSTGESIYSSPTIAEIDGDGELEILVGSYDNSLYCISPSGDVNWTFEADDRIHSTVSIGDVWPYNQGLEIVFGSDDFYIYCLDDRGEIIWKYKTDGWVGASPALSDIDNDGFLEVIVGSYDGNLYCISSHGLLKWKYSTTREIEFPASIADTDGDGNKEIIFSSFDKRVYCLDSNGILKWSKEIFHSIGSPLAIADVDGDGKLEILGGSFDYNLYCFGKDGDVKWKYTTDSHVMSGPAIGDIDSDGKLEIIFGSYDNNIYCLESGLANEKRMPWPMFMNNLFHNSVYENTKPVCWVVYPDKERGVLSGIVKIKVSAFDPNLDDEIEGIHIEYSDNNGQTWNPLENISDGFGLLWSMNWDTREVPDGDYYKIRSRATDGKSYSSWDESHYCFGISNNESMFDTGKPENPYPSIMGNHTGTIKPNHTVIATKLYTYSCEGTGGHTEYAKIGNLTWNATATWEGYMGDWHNITFDKTVVLLANKTYNYTIRTGSYPQIHHTDALPTANGWINCTKFTDANGKVYYDWIPAIRLWA